jgi:hypothetical protein
MDNSQISAMKVSDDLVAGRFQRRGTAMITFSEYWQFARACIKWAAETQIDESRNALIDLACDWTFPGLALDRSVEEPPSATFLRGANCADPVLPPSRN